MTVVEGTGLFAGLLYAPLVSDLQPLRAVTSRYEPLRAVTSRYEPLARRAASLQLAADSLASGEIRWAATLYMVGIWSVRV
jgi:hypothetical protein